MWNYKHDIPRFENPLRIRAREEQRSTHRANNLLCWAAGALLGLLLIHICLFFGGFWQ